MPGVLVVAGHGFIGRAVCSELARQGRLAVPLARSGPEGCDLLDAASVEAAMQRHRPEAVVNCAGVTHASEAGPSYEVHVSGTLRLLEAVRRHVPASPVVLLGSAAEYGPDAALPTGEDCPARPTTFYGASKLAQTRLGQVAASAWGMKVRTARLFNVIGAGLPERYFLAALAARLRALPAGSTFPVRDSRATRDFVDLRDAARAIVLLAGPDAPCGVFNVATGIETSIGEAASLLGELAGGMKPVPDEDGAGLSRSAGDPARLRGLGWEPRFGWGEAARSFWGAAGQPRSKGDCR